MNYGKIRLESHCWREELLGSLLPPPPQSHMGGAWERQIRTIRKVLQTVPQEQTLNDESLHTLICEVEAILHNWPIISHL